MEVEVVYNGREIRKTLQPALDASEKIDMFDEDIERVGNTWGNYLLNLEPYMSKTYPTTDGKAYESVLNQTLIKLVREIGNGEIHEIPYQPSMFIVMYNKTLFEKAGIAETPETFDEMEEAFKKLKAIGVSGITVDDAYMAAFFGYNMSRIIGVVETLKMVEDNDFSNPGVLKFAEIWSDFSKKGYMSRKAASNIFPAGQVEEMAKGTCAMYLDGTWLPNEIKGNAPDMKWGSFAYPAYDESICPNTANNYGAQCFGINKDSEVADEAFQLITFLTTGEWDEKLADYSIGVPMANDSQWPEQLKEAKMVLNSTTTRMPWAVGMESNPEINVKIKENLAKLITGSITPQEFYSNMQK
ncbi:MAG: extracellular solute-binding protein [Sphaerochaetaceae bacterium]|nr:extracellular solute-binding protein [Sphaerochaetaceae bacterium]